MYVLEWSDEDCRRVTGEWCKSLSWSSMIADTVEFDAFFVVFVVDVESISGIRATLLCSIVYDTSISVIWLENGVKKNGLRKEVKSLERGKRKKSLHFRVKIGHKIGERTFHLLPYDRILYN